MTSTSSFKTILRSLLRSILRSSLQQDSALPPKISQSSKAQSFSSQKGLTLVEIMVVMAIIGLLIGVMAPKLMGNNQTMKHEIRRIYNLSKSLRSKARIHNRTYRIVIEIPDATDRPGDKKSRYWVESTDKPVVLKTLEELEEGEGPLPSPTPSGEDEEGSAPAPSGFQPDTGIVKEKRDLPKGIHFTEVEIAGLERSVKEGLAYIHFFPSGMVEEAAIHLGDGDKLYWTITTDPMSGPGEMYGKEIRLKDTQVK